MECSFCGENIEQGTGKVVSTEHGEINAYCSSKCEKNAKKGLKPQKQKWTKKYKREKGEKA